MQPHFDFKDLPKELLEPVFRALESRGYSTEHDDDNQLMSTVMEWLAVPSFFELVTHHHFPGEKFDFDLSCLATDEGGPAKCFDYALYDGNKISREDVIDILRRQRLAYPWGEYVRM